MSEDSSSIHAGRDEANSHAKPDTETKVNIEKDHTFVEGTVPMGIVEAEQSGIIEQLALEEVCTIM